MIKKLAAYVRGYTKYMVLGPICVIIEVICEMQMPLLMARIVDVGIQNLDSGYIWSMGLWMTALAVAAIGLGCLNMWFSANASQGFSANLRRAMFDRIQSFSFSNIDKFSTASLVTRLTNDVTQVQNAVLMGLRMLIRAPLMLIIALITVINMNARLSLIFVVAVPLLAGVILFVRGRAEKLFAAVQRKLDGLNGTVQENLIAIRVVKAFVRESHERVKFNRASDELMEASVRAVSLVIVVFPAMNLILSGAVIATIWFGGGMVSAGSMGIGEMMGFISYVMQIMMSVMMFSFAFVMLARIAASARRIIEVLDTEPDVRDPQALPEALTEVSLGRVEFRGVDFKYTATGSGENVLSDITFTAEPGEVVGIVGGTGAGKSTLVNLIARLYDVTGGQVLVDGRDVREYPLEELRGGIGMVLQKNVLFSGTIRENLLWGDANADEPALERAAGDAQAAEFIERFPDGYETILGQGGVNVSGGQKQRLSIARAMLKRPRILILDDSTSAVDSTTEGKIRQSFRDNLKDTTVFIIAQRISSVREADKIIVLDDGRIMGLGTHEELMRDNRIYREINQSQREGAIA